MGIIDAKSGIIRHANGWACARNGQVIFRNLPAGSTMVNIFGVDGSLVMSLGLKDNSALAWNGMRSNGARVASGNYYYTVSGEKRGSGRISLVK